VARCHAANILSLLLLLTGRVQQHHLHRRSQQELGLHLQAPLLRPDLLPFHLPQQLQLVGHLRRDGHLQLLPRCGLHQRWRLPP
jgi:hypothetical protein